MANKRDVDAWKKRMAILMADETRFDEKSKNAMRFVIEMFDLYCENVPMKCEASASDSPKA